MSGGKLIIGVLERGISSSSTERCSNVVTRSVPLDVFNVELSEIVNVELSIPMSVELSEIVNVELSISIFVELSIPMSVELSEMVNVELSISISVELSEIVNVVVSIETLSFVVEVVSFKRIGGNVMTGDNRL